MKNLISTIFLSLSKVKHLSAARNSRRRTITNNRLVFTAWSESDSYLYIGTNHGIFRKSKLNADLEFRTKKNSPLPDDHITGIVCTQEGYTFIGTRNGMVKCDNKATFMITPIPLHLPDHHITALTVDSNDDLWIGTANSGLAKSTGAKNDELSLHRVETSNKNIYSLSVDSIGSVWVVFQNGIIEYFRKGSYRSQLSVPSIEETALLAEKCFLLNTSCQGTFLADGNSLRPLSVEPTGEKLLCSYYNVKYSRLILCNQHGVNVFNISDPFTSHRQWRYSDFIQSISMGCTNQSKLKTNNQLKEFGPGTTI